jgi:hypothetical protein
MSEVIPIESLYIFTTVVDGLEQIVVGPDKMPFIYLDTKPIKEGKIVEQVQEWSNYTGTCFTLRLFKQSTIVDIIEPMKTTQTM